MNNKSGFTSCLGVIVLLFAAIVTGAISRGFVLTKLWAWFIQPVFESAPSLSIVTAIGLGMVVSFLTYQVSAEQNKNKSSSDITEVIVTMFLYQIGYPLMTLVIAWVVTWFI